MIQLVAHKNGYDNQGDPEQLTSSQAVSALLATSVQRLGVPGCMVRQVIQAAS